MEIFALALLIVAAFLLLSGQWIKSRHRKRQHKFNAYQPVKSTYQPTFEDPAATGGSSQSTTPALTTAPGLPSVDAEAREVAERMARDLAALLQSKGARNVSFESTVTSTSSSQAPWVTSNAAYTDQQRSSTYTERSISLTEETASRIKALALAGKRSEALDLLVAETGLDGKGALMMLDMIVEQY